MAYHHLNNESQVFVIIENIDILSKHSGRKGKIVLRDCCFKFLNRSVPIYPKREIILKPNEQKLVKVKAPFVDEISGLAIIKILDGGTYSTLLI